MGERPRPDVPHSGKRPPPGAPLCRHHSARSQLARARAVGLVTGPHAHTPRTHSQSVTDPGRTPQGRAVGRGRAPNPRRPTPRQEVPPAGALVSPPQRARPGRKNIRCGVGDGSPCPNPPHPQPVGSAPGPHAPRTGGRARESAQPRTPHAQARSNPLGALVLPHIAQSQLGRARAVGLVAGYHAHTPCTHSQWVAGPGRTPEGWAVRLGRAPNRGRPTTRQETPPPPPRAPWCRPHGAQSQLARARSVGLVTGLHAHTPRTGSQWVAGSGRMPLGRAFGRARAANPGRPIPRREVPPHGRPHAAPTARKASTQKQACPQGGARPQARQGDKGTGQLPQELNRQSTGPGQETRRVTNRLEWAYRRPAPEPRVVRAPHRPGGGGRRKRRGSTSGHTRNGHAARTRRATGPSPRNAQTAWTGGPAGEGNGHPGGTTRNTHREGREGRVELKGRSKNRQRPGPPRASRQCRAHTTRALHLPRQ